MNNYPSPEIVARLSLQKFESLPKTGKPTTAEWTVLSTIVQFDSKTGKSKVVALGSGTKCIGQSKLCPLGLILNDSHGEVLARRAFLRYLLHQLGKNDGIFKYNQEKRVFCLNEGVSFHFFSTQVPCGDACIASELVETPTKRRKLSTTNSAIGDELTSSVFTGAKLIGSKHTDLMEQTVGALRIKPGRGDRTLSMSCSDKLSRWNVLGLQGALLDSILEKPVFLETMTFACEFDKDALTRAIYERWEHKDYKNDRFSPHKPAISKSPDDLRFQHSQDDEKNPSPSGLVWCEVPIDCCPYEVSVNGKKQGITKKALHTRKSSLRISKVNILEQFTNLISGYPTIMQKFALENEELNKRTYGDYKHLSTSYQEAWTAIKLYYFRQWTSKPKNLLDFSLESCNKATGH